MTSLQIKDVPLRQASNLDFQINFKSQVATITSLLPSYFFKSLGFYPVWNLSSLQKGFDLVTFRNSWLLPYNSRSKITYFNIVQKLHKNANLIQVKNVIELVPCLVPCYLKKEQVTYFSENDHMVMSAKIQTYFF